jgi:hypothetical protein
MNNRVNYNLVPIINKINNQLFPCLLLTMLNLTTFYSKNTFFLINLLISSTSYFIFIFI